MFDFITTDPVLQIVGIFYLVVGIAFMVRPEPWRELVTVMTERETVIALWGLVPLAFGLIILLAIPSFESIGRAMLTCFGYLAIAEAVLFLFFPRSVQKFLTGGFYQGLFKISGALSVFIGVAFLLLG